MKKFIRNLLIFIIPLILIGVSAELLLRGIPNDYKLKREFLDRNSNNIQMLFLGSSHAYRGINPVFFHLNSFNAGYISQTLDYDFDILKKYDGSWSNLEIVVIPISYFSLFVKLSDSTESWRVKNYNIYYKMATSKKISDYFEILSNIFRVNYRRIYSYYFQGKSNITGSKLGWGKIKSGKKRNLIRTGKKAAKRHTVDTRKFFKENINLINSFLLFVKKRNLKLLFYTPPAFHTYVENLNTDQLNITTKFISDIANKHNNCYYINFLQDKAFTDLHFGNADHLNEIGAQVLSLKLDRFIKELRQEK